MGWFVFMGWVISQANEWENYSTYFGEGGRDFREFWNSGVPSGPLPTF